MWFATQYGLNKFEHPELPTTINIQDVLVVNKDILWVATYRNSIYILNLENHKTSRLTENKNHPYTR